MKRGVASFRTPNQNCEDIDMPNYEEIFSNSEHCVAIPLRLIVGHGFVEHGYAKLIDGHADFAGILHALGVPAPVATFERWKTF